jgi:hypothetical protein
MRYRVTLHVDVESESEEAAAVEADRILWTNRPRDFAVTAPAPRGGTVFVRVERGEAKRTA